MGELVQTPTHWALPPLDAYASGISSHDAARFDAGMQSAVQDALIEELPVSLEFFCDLGQLALVMMATPLDLEAFALGFALTEGIADSRAQVLSVNAVPAACGMAVLVELVPDAWLRVQSRQRSGAASSSCGLCGLTDMQAALHAPKVAASALRVAPAAISAAFAVLPSKQRLGAQTGASHAAAWVSTQGEIVLIAEDAGRHNAMDKLVGMMAQRELSAGDGFCAISSRASFEMVQKAARAGFGVLAAISAPTALAVRLAQESGLTLVAFARGDRMSCFTHESRLGAAVRDD